MWKLRLTGYREPSTGSDASKRLSPVYNAEIAEVDCGAGTLPVCDSGPIRGENKGRAYGTYFPLAISRNLSLAPDRLYALVLLGVLQFIHHGGIYLAK